MRNRSVRAFVVVSLAATLVGVTGAVGARAASPTPRGEPIAVASFDFTESRLLAEIYAQALDRAGLPVHRAFGLGPRELVAPALREGLVDVVPEYAGTAVQFLSIGRAHPEADVAVTHAALVRALQGTVAQALAPAPAQDSNAFVVRREVARRLGLAEVSDLRTVSRQLTFGGPPECATRPLCLEGLRRVYDIEFNEVVPLDAGGRLTRQALESGIVDVALLFSTDPALGTGDLVELVDDRALQPAENVTPIVRRATVDRYGPRLVATLDAVSARMDTETLRDLNARVQATGSVRSTATQWLDDQQLP
jgi:osmoprotectant transport system substrate-binding protein